MAILKNKTQNNFVMISRSITQDQDLGLTERGLLLTLMSLPDGWNLSIKGLEKILPDGKDKIGKALNNLIEHGYVTREQERNGHGSFGTNVLVINETPMDGENSPYPGNPDAVKPDTEKPQTGKPSPENPSQYNNKDIKYIKEKNKEYNNKECSEDTLAESEYDSLVSEFGKEIVDYQIERIKNNNYKGCMNYKTIHEWCVERKDRDSNKVIPYKQPSTSHGFQGRNYSDDEYKMIEELMCARGVS